MIKRRCFFVTHQLRHLSLLICLGTFTNTYAQHLPIFDSAKLIANHQEKITHRNFDLKRSTQNDTLDLSYSMLKNQDMPAITTYLKNHPEITKLNLQGNNLLTGAGITPLAKIKSLKELNLARSEKDCPNGICIGGLTSKNMQAFASNTSLRVLNLSWHSIGDDGANIVAKLKNLKYVDVTNNNITDAGGMALAQSTNLKMLSIAYNELSSATANLLANNNSLRVLKVGATNFNDQDAAVLAKNYNLIELSLFGTNVTDTGAIELAKNQTLQKLNLSYNAITANGAKALAANTSLKSLELSGDIFYHSLPTIGDEGASAFSTNTTLEELSLNDEKISAAGVAAIVKIPTLKKLSLYVNRNIGDAGALLIAQQAPQLTELDLTACRISDIGIQAIAAMPSLKAFYADSNYIGDVGAMALAYNVKLRTLSIAVNDIYDPGAIAFSQNKTLIWLDISLNRFTEVGDLALENNSDIKTLFMGGTNPYPPHAQDLQVKNIIDSQMLKTGFCYHINGMLKCVRS